MSLVSLQRRVAKLDRGGAAPPPSLGPGWWDEFEGFALLADPSWRPYCSLDQFLVGRASTVARWWRVLDSYASWHQKQEPNWWSSKAWQSKTPDWQGQIERQRRLFCPPENRKTMAGFLQWLYSDAPRCWESEIPWLWCGPDVGSQYHWPGYKFHQQGLLPVAHALVVASACWLVDDLGLKPQQVSDNASAHYCAFKWRDLSRLAQVQLPDRPITGTSPKLRIAEMTAWALAHDIPGDEERSRQGDRLELLELLMCVASGCASPHGRELWFPALGARF